MHPSDRIRSTASHDLDGKRIVLGLSGSIAAVKCVELARELIRHGADVVPVMTPAACGIITPDAMEFATGRKPITALSGSVEHVAAFGEGGDADLLLVAPATANTIGKIALGIDDTALTTFATVALGAGRPILIAPAMHLPMETHPAVQAHVETLKGHGVRFVRPIHEEGKAKLAAIDDIIGEVRRTLGPRTWEGRHVLVVSGPSSEPIDTVRVITNRSTGTMGLRVAHEAHRLGAALTVVTSQTDLAWPGDATVIAFQNTAAIGATIERLAKDTPPDWVFVPAALADFAPPRQPGKIDSDRGDVTIPMSPVPKLLPKTRKTLPKARIVGWKLQDSLDEAITAAKGRISDYNVDAIVANGTATLAGDDGEAALVLADQVVPLGAGSKETLARALFAALDRHLAR